MPTLTQLIAADRRIQAAITRAEGTPKRPKARKGWRVILPQRDRVTGQIVRDVAWPRLLVWMSYLVATRKPTRASMERMAHRMRGYGLYYYALWAQAHGHPLPTDHTPPASALHSSRRVTRADTSGNQKDYGEKWLTPDPNADYPDIADDAAAWWDEYGWDTGLPDMPMTPDERAAWDAETLSQVTQSLEFDTWLNNSVLGDLQVLQILETYWNGQAMLFSGQSMLGDMGIAGDFNLVDPVAMDFLRYQSGIFVKGMAGDEKTRQQLAEALWSGWGGDAAEGVGPFAIPQLAKYVQETMRVQENGLMEMSRSRAYLIAVTEVARAETFGQFVSMLGTGVQRKAWMVTTGACIVCNGNASMGDIPILDLFPSGHYAPPSHPRCFPAGTWVSGPKPIGSINRLYEGALIEIRTRSGNLLSVTPNHPILTPQGWVAAGKLRKGDDVVCGGMLQSTVALVDPDDYQMPALIEDVAVSLGGASSVTASPVKIAAEDLHGDGVDGQIGIVRSNGFLRGYHNRLPRCQQPLLHKSFGGRNIRRFRLNTLGNFTTHLPRLSLSAYRIMCRTGIPLPLFCGSSRRKKLVGLGIAAKGDTRIRQYTTHCRTLNTVSLGESVLGLPRLISGNYCIQVRRHPCPSANGDPVFMKSIGDGMHTYLEVVRQRLKRFSSKIPGTDGTCIQRQSTAANNNSVTNQYSGNGLIANSIPDTDGLGRFTSGIQLDDIISIDIRQFSGHVFNLETPTGWYVASNNVPHSDEKDNCNGIIVHNCRCSLAPGIPDGPFNPKDWQFAPSADQLQRLFSDPSFAQWPNQVVDLTHPELQLTPPGPGALGDFGRLPYSSLPDGLQQVIDPSLYANNYTDAWNTILSNVGQSVNQAAQADQSTKIAEDAAYFTPSGPGGAALTLDDILGKAPETPADLTDFTERLRSALDDALGNLDLGGA